MKFFDICNFLHKAQYFISSVFENTNCHERLEAFCANFMSKIFMKYPG